MTKRAVAPHGAPEYVTDIIREIEALKRRIRTLEPVGNLSTYTVATVPSVTGREKLIMVSDETGGHTVAYSDGANWRRVQDRAVVS